MTHSQETISTHTVKNDATTTIVTRTTTIVSEHEEVVEDGEHAPRGPLETVRETLRDYWFGNNEDENDDDDEEEAETLPPFPFKSGHRGVMHRAYDYWKSLTHDAEEEAKVLVEQAKKARDEAAKEAKYSFWLYKKEAQDALKAAEEKYREALAAAERTHEEALERAKHSWFKAADITEKEVSQAKDELGEVTHRRWDKFKSSVDSLFFHPPKYGCSPSSQYWFSRQNPGVDSGWDCREIWDHPQRHDHAHIGSKVLPKKVLPADKVHDTFASLFHQASLKAKSAPSVSGAFEGKLKAVKDYYHSLLDRITRNDQAALEELDSVSDKVKAKLLEAKYHEEQTDTWLASQWNAVADNAGDAKQQYQRVFKNTLRSVKNARNEAYNQLINNLQKSINQARSNVKEAIRTAKDDSDKARIQKAVRDAIDQFSHTIKEAETKIKGAPKQAYEHAVEAFQRDTSHLKEKLEQAAKDAEKSASSIHHHASKTVSSAAREASEAAKGFQKDASHKLDEMRSKASGKYASVTDHAKDHYDRATASASSIWGAATPYPYAPLNHLHDQYVHMLDSAKSGLFGHQHQGSANASSLYGTVLAMYLLFLARRIWARRGLDRLARREQLQSQLHSSGSEGEHEGREHSRAKNRHRHGNGKGVTPLYARVAQEDVERDAFGTVLTQFTSVVPLTLMLLILLELGGLSRVVLHALFLGLVESQLLIGGVFDNLLLKLGLVDGFQYSGRDMGTLLSWAILGTAAVLSGLKGLLGLLG
ncbi:hypothetical protein DFQ27_007548 [Actinomortierella ambigua]|uniref:Uncharacterized protein n=1 Tax=Actinomortierella ambigua TaxID=1343610 RepID=A0A9P6QP62_9FUNG|nr:hypothetical protein DFQ27_007548 [Actinomortierella ambigua]